MENFEIDIVFYSTKAFEKFIDVKPEVVIIDFDIVINIDMFLKEISQCSWIFDTYIFSSSDLREKTSFGQFCFLYDEMSKVAKSILEKPKDRYINENINIDNTNIVRKHYPVKEKFYSVILCKYNGSKQDVVDEYKKNNIISKINQIGEVINFQILQNDIIINVDTTKKKSNIIEDIHREVIHTIDCNYTTLYIDEVTLDRVNFCLDSILDVIDYTYFLNGKCIRLDSINVKEDCADANKVLSFCVELLNGLINKNDKIVKDSLNNTFNEEVKVKCDFTSLEIYREAVKLCIEVVENATGIMFNFNKTFHNMEDELGEYIRYFNDILEKRKEVEISKHTMEAVVYTMKNYNEVNLSLNEMSEILCVNKMYLSRVFKKDTKLTYLNFLLKIRIFFAKIYLCNGKLKIREVALKVGYEDSHYFTKIFKKHTKYTPKEFQAKSVEGIDESFSCCK